MPTREIPVRSLSRAPSSVEEMQIRNDQLLDHVNDPPESTKSEAHTTFKHTFRDIKRHFQVTYTNYKLRRPSAYNDKATRELKELCLSKYSDTYQIVDALERGADPNAFIGEGFETPLHRLVRRGLYDAVYYLVQAGADVNAQNTRHQTPLILASDTTRVGASVKIVRLLLQQPTIKPKMRDIGGNTALVCAIFKNNAAIVREFLLAGCSVTTDTPSPYDVALWIFATHIHMSVEELPAEFLHPRSLTHLLLHGRYSLSVFTALQSLAMSDIELVFRMMQYKKHQEESQPMSRAMSLGQHAVEEKSQEPKTTENAEEQRKARRTQKLKQRKIDKQNGEIERWNNKLKKIAATVNEQYGSKVDVHTELQWRRVEDRESEQYGHWQATPADKSRVYSRNALPGMISVAETPNIPTL